MAARRESTELGAGKWSHFHPYTGNREREQKIRIGNKPPQSLPIMVFLSKALS